MLVSQARSRIRLAGSGLWRRSALAVVVGLVTLVTLVSGSAAAFAGPSSGTDDPCQPTNEVDVAIPDNGSAVFSAVNTTGCDEVVAPTRAVVHVEIVHPHVGDLVIDLISPDRSAHRIKDSDPQDATVNLNQTYIVSLAAASSSPLGVAGFGPNTWLLQVQDVISGNVGFIDTWTLAI
jgi:subtilisin-like proprotein convertase family protein